MGSNSSTLTEDLGVMRAGLRVLSALCEESGVNPGDLYKLRHAIPDLAVSVPLDQLACEVIQRGLRNRKAQREGVLRPLLLIRRN
jgi:hypothetical protein